jgi:hypothetical protein
MEARSAETPLCGSVHDSPPARLRAGTPTKVDHYTRDVIGKIARTEIIRGSERERPDMLHVVFFPPAAARLKTLRGRKRAKVRHIRPGSPSSCLQIHVLATKGTYRSPRRRLSVQCLATSCRRVSNSSSSLIANLSGAGYLARSVVTPPVPAEKRTRRESLDFTLGGIVGEGDPDAPPETDPRLQRAIDSSEPPDRARHGTQVSDHFICSISRRNWVFQLADLRRVLMLPLDLLARRRPSAKRRTTAMFLAQWPAR